MSHLACVEEELWITDSTAIVLEHRVSVSVKGSRNKTKYSADGLMHHHSDKTGGPYHIINSIYILNVRFIVCGRAL